jgi:hypothetical protein
MRYLMLVALLTASSAVATPMSSSREKANALGFHQHQPKSSLHGYSPAPVVADTDSTSGETPESAPSPGPGRIAPVNKTAAPSTPPLGPGRIAPVDKKTPPPTTPERCMTGRMGGADSVPWGCAISQPPKQIPEPGTGTLLVVGLMALWLRRFAKRFQLRRIRSVVPAPL